MREPAIATALALSFLVALLGLLLSAAGLLPGAEPPHALPAQRQGSILLDRPSLPVASAVLAPILPPEVTAALVSGPEPSAAPGDGDPALAPGPAPAAGPQGGAGPAQGSSGPEGVDRDGPRGVAVDADKKEAKADRKADKLDRKSARAAAKGEKKTIKAAAKSGKKVAQAAVAADTKAAKVAAKAERKAGKAAVKAEKKASKVAAKSGKKPGKSAPRGRGKRAR